MVVTEFLNKKAPAFTGALYYHELKIIYKVSIFLKIEVGVIEMSQRAGTEVS